MDIAALSMSMANNDLAAQVSIAVLKMGQDMIQDNGGQMVDMIKQMEHSVQPHIGGTIDISL